MEHLLEYLFSIFLIFPLGFIAWQDFRYNKISNTPIAIIFLIGLFYYISGLMASHLPYFLLPDGVTIYFPFVDEFLFALQSFLIALLPSLVFWYFGFLRKEDVRLFSVLSFAIPSLFFQDGSLILFPSLSLLINILFVWLLLLFVKYNFNFLNNTKEKKTFFSLFSRKKNQTKHFGICFLLGTVITFFLKTSILYALIYLFIN